MDDMNPIVLAAILRESLGFWFWPAVLVALVLLALVVLGFAKVLRAGRSPMRPVLAGLVAMLVTATAVAFVVPGWTLAELSALSGPVDYATAFLLALAPGAVVGTLVFFAAASRCAARAHAPA